MLSSSPATRDKILEAALAMLATEGAEGTSMRRLADRVGVKQPVIYYYFGSKQELMKTVFQTLVMRLGMAVHQLAEMPDAPSMLRQRILFHLEQAPLIMAMLNYYLMDKRAEAKLRIPPAAYRHIQDVIERGIEAGIYESKHTGRDAGIIVHALNGFAMEHFPHIASQRDSALVEDIAVFIERSLRRTS